MSDNKHIAIIGCGLSAAVLCQRLSAAGITVTLFEKSRGSGGRLASCRLDNGSADLGAPCFTPDQADFQHWLEQQPGILRWQPEAANMALQTSEAPTCYVCASRQSALTRTLISGADLITSTRVGAIRPRSEAEQQVQVLDETSQPLGGFDAVIVTAPAEQAAPLLQAVPMFAETATVAEASSSWVMVVQVRTSARISADLIQGDHPVLKRCIRDSAKPGRMQPEHGIETWFIEATAQWSEQHRDSEPDTVAAQLQEAFFALLAQANPQPPELLFQRCHRWLYSRYPDASAQNAQAYLWDEERGIGACGDWLSSGDLEGAWRSASALADALLEG